MVAPGKVAQAVEGYDLAVDHRLGVKLLAVELETVVHKVEVVAQRISEANVRSIRLYGKRNSPGNLGHAICALGEGPRLRPRDFAVLDRDFDRSHTREHDRCVAA